MSPGLSAPLLVLLVAVALPAQRGQQAFVAGGDSYFRARYDQSTWFLLGDVDGNGSPDLVSGTNHRVARVHRGDGGGRFTEVASLVIQPESGAGALGDIDGDGDLDLLVSGEAVLSIRHSVAIFHNDGSGGFTPSGVTLPPINPLSRIAPLLLFDADTDGDLDLLRGSPLEIWWNDGAGNYSLGPSFSQFAKFFRWTDLDGDGDRDVLTGSSGSWLRRDGPGVFTPQQLSLPASHTVVDVADLDGDGDTDLLVEDSSRIPAVFLHDGSGGFANVGRRGLGPVDRPIDLVDVDADGDIDVLTRGLAFANSSAARFSALKRMQLLGALGQPRAFADLDGDGLPEMLTIGVAAIRPSFNVQGREFVHAGVGAPLSSALLGSHVVDVNGDGMLDLISRRSLAINDGRGGFVPGTLPALPTTANSSVADIDTDGDVDLFVQTSIAGPRLLLNDGTAIFSIASPLPAGLNTVGGRHRVFEDFDGDGDLDIVSITAPTVSYHENVGSEGFARRPLPQPPSLKRQVLAGDVDGDGDVDVMLFDVGHALLRNQGGTLVLASGVTFPPPLAVYAAALVDIDGDRDLDMIETTSGLAPSPIKILRNDGSSFVDVTTTAWAAPFGLTFSTVGDHDGDGDADFIASDLDAAKLVTNDGTGTFALAAESLFPSLGRQVFFGGLADFDGDGDLDLLGRNTLWGLERQLHTPWLARSGREFAVELHDRGPGTRVGAFWLGGTLAAPVVLPGIGRLHVDPTLAIVRPPQLLAPGVTQVASSFTVPAAPTFLGLTFHVQGVVAATSSQELALTNVSTELVVR